MVISRKKSVLRGAFSNALTSVFLQMINLLIIPIYLDLTSEELYGLWLTLGAVLAWVKIGDMGLGLSLTRRAVEALEAGNYELLRNYLTASICITLLFGSTIFMIGYSTADYISDFLNVRVNYKDDFRNAFLILLVVAWIRPSCSMLSSIVNAKQHIAFLHIQNTTASLCAIGITLLLLFYGYGVSAFAYGLLAEAIMILIIGYSYLKYYDNEFFVFPLKCRFSDIKKLLQFGVPYQALKITNLVATNTDNIVIAVYLGTAAVTTYVFTGKLAFLLSVFLISIAPSVLFPGFTQLFEQNETVKIKRLYLKLSDIALRLGVISAVFFYFVNEIFVTAWVSDQTYGGYYLTVGFVFWILFESFTRGVTAIIYASGDMTGLTLVSCVEALLNIFLTLLLIAPLGMLGVVLGTVFSRIITVCYIPMKINNMLGINQFEYLVRLVKTIPVCTVVMLISGIALEKWMSPDLNPLVKIFTFGFLLLSVNILSFEGVFLYKLQGLSLHARLNILKERYLSH